MTNKLISAIGSSTTTENGCVTLPTSESKTLDFFFMVGALRRETDERILNVFRSAYSEDKMLSFKILSYARDIRGGMGERRIFRLCIKELANLNCPVLKENISLIPEYGRWDDVISLFNTPLEGDALNLIRDNITSP